MMTQRCAPFSERYEACVLETAFAEVLEREADELEKLPLSEEEKALLAHAETVRERNLALITSASICRCRRKRLVKFCETALRYAAIVILAVMISLGTALAVSPDFRRMAVDFLTQVTPDYVQIGTVPEEPEIPEGAQVAFYSQLAPTGFALESIKQLEGYIQIVLENQARERIMIFISEDVNSTRIDARNTECQRICLHDQEAYLLDEGAYTTVTWNNEMAYYIVCAQESEDAVTVADVMTDTQ